MGLDLLEPEAKQTKHDEEAGLCTHDIGQTGTRPIAQGIGR